MGRFSGKTCRLSVMLALTTSFFVVEITVGYVTNSIALVADSFHMLSDVVALFVGFASVKISKWPSKRNTYGWVRAEILGALVNAVFLLALCFSILVEALKRLVEVEKVDNPMLLLIVGAVGLFINVIGLFLFGGHGHSHGGGGHGHSHGGGGHGHSHGHAHGHSGSIEDDSQPKVMANGSSQPHENQALVAQEPVSSSSLDDRDVYVSPSTNITIDVNKPKIAGSSQLNMRGVFLHVLGDALGSVVVVISALVIWFAEGDWKYMVDPSMSVLMVFIILSTTIPLLKESAFILLQTVPSHVNVEKIIGELEQMEGIYGVHECHIWQLAGSRIIASAHIRCHGIEEYMTLASKIKALFHQAGIHSTTIQPEFVDYQDLSIMDCALPCDGKEAQCKKDTCCGDRTGWLSKRNKSSSCIANTNVGANRNNSAQHIANSSQLMDVQFSPDGDEVVLEMSGIRCPAPDGGDFMTPTATKEH